MLDGRTSYCAPHITFEFSISAASMAVTNDNQHRSPSTDASTVRSEARLLWSEINRSNRLLKIAAWVAVVLIAACTVMCWLDIPHWPMWR
jgi:hypothetical protein